MHTSNFCFSADPTKHFAIGHVNDLFQLTVRPPDKNTRTAHIVQKYPNGIFVQKYAMVYPTKIPSAKFGIFVGYDI